MANPARPVRSSAATAIAAVVLFSVFPILNLLSSNAEQVSILSAVRSACIAVLGALLLVAGARLALRNWPTAALLVIGALLLFFSYGHVYDLLRHDGDRRCGPRSSPLPDTALDRSRPRLVLGGPADGITCLAKMVAHAGRPDGDPSRLVLDRAGDADDAGPGTGGDSGSQRDRDGLRRGVARHLLHHPGRLRPVGCPRRSLRDRQHGFLALPGTARLLRGRRRQKQLLQDHPVARLRPEHAVPGRDRRNPGRSLGQSSAT